MSKLVFNLSKTILLKEIKRSYYSNFSSKDFSHKQKIPLTVLTLVFFTLFSPLFLKLISLLNHSLKIPLRIFWAFYMPYLGKVFPPAFQLIYFLSAGNIFTQKQIVTITLQITVLLYKNSELSINFLPVSDHHYRFRRENSIHDLFDYVTVVLVKLLLLS